jgi:hypothetical protein
MAVSSRFRTLTFVLLTGAALTFAVLTVPHSGANAASSRYKAPNVDQTRMLLRLHDLPPGYANGYLGEGRGEDGVLCAALTDPPDTPARLAKFVRAYRPKGCIASYRSLFTPAGAEPRAPLVDSGAMVLGSAAAADAAWDLLPTLLSRVTKHHRMPAAEPAPVEVGTEARLFHTSAVPFTYTRSGRSTSFLAWRSGNVVAVVMAISNSFAASDATVAELAPRQQAHILKPTPYTTAERFDGEVGLDDPAIDLPVYWLGRNFRPRRGLPQNRLFRSSFRAEPIPESSEGFIKEGPIAPLQVDYENIWLETWTPATWHVFANSATGRVVTTWKCTQTKAVALPGGTATIFGGYAQDFKRCPKRGPDVFTAWVEVGDITLVVNAPFAPDFIERVNPYGSFAGMEAIIGALKLRPQPTY